MELIVGQKVALTGQDRIDANKMIDQLMEVPRMTKDFVVFQMIGIKPDPEPHNKGRMLAPSIYNLPCTTNVKLRNSDDVVPLHFVEAMIPDPSKGGSGNVPLYTEITFDKGMCMVSKMRKPQYEYMMLHPENTRNAKIYGVQPTFFLIDTDSTKADEFKKFEKAFKIEKRFLDIPTGDDEKGRRGFTKIQLFAKAIGVNTEQAFQAIRFDCIQKIKADNSLIDLLDSPDMILRAIVYQAFDLNIVAFHEKTNEVGYVLPNSFTKITTIPLGTSDPKAYFASWLKEDITGTFDVLRMKVGQAEGIVMEDESEQAPSEPDDTRTNAEKLKAINDEMLASSGAEPKVSTKKANAGVEAMQKKRREAELDKIRQEQQPGTGAVIDKNDD